jgi:hypothetical protein
VSRALPFLGLLVSGLPLLGAAGCGSAPPPPPSQTRSSPRPEPAASPLATPRPTPTPSAKPAKPASLRVYLAGPSGSSLAIGESRIGLPGSLEFGLKRKTSAPVSGRLNLNALSQELKIPSSARAHLEGDGRGVWIRVQGACEVASGPASAPIRLRLGEEGLLRILAGKSLSLSDAQARVQISLALAN